MRKPFVALIAAALLAGLGWVDSGRAANVTANTTLKLNITVSVANTVRITWGPASTLLDSSDVSVANTTNDAIWPLGQKDFGSTILLSAGDPPTPPASTLTIINRGNPSIQVVAKMSVVDGIAVPRTPWALGGPGVDQYKLTLTSSGGAGPVFAGAVVLTAADQGIVTGLKRTSGEMNLELSYEMPTDTVDQAALPLNAQHSHQVLFTASAG